jgi:hypothetical protein
MADNFVEAAGNRRTISAAAGGRFGTHASNENMTPIYYKRLMFFSHFNAGVRAVDIRDPYHPTQVGYYIPAITENMISAASNSTMASSAARSRSSQTTSKSTIAGTSTLSIAPTPGCTSSN